MLTLVAVVLVYDMARETWDARSSTVEATEGAPGRRGAGLLLLPLPLPLRSRRLRSWTRLEKDMLLLSMLFELRSGREYRWEKSRTGGGAIEVSERYRTVIAMTV